MTETEIKQVLDRLIADWEDECAEFKQAGNDYDLSKIGRYFSALSNEANLRGQASAWLVFGVNNRRRIVGTDYRKQREQLDSLKHQIAQGTNPSTSFQAIHEVSHGGKRVILFQIPAAPRGIPIAWQTHFYARNGESLAGLSLAKQDEIRAQSGAEDWSAAVCEMATIGIWSPRR